MKKTSLGKILYYLLHLAGLVLLYFVLKDFDWQSFGRLFSSFTLWPFVAGYIMLALTYLLKTYRYMLINRSFGINISYGTTLVFFLVSGFLSVITPGRIGEFAKIYYVGKKAAVNTATSTSAVVLDRIWDVLILTLLGGLSVVLLLGGFQIDTLTIFVILIIFLAALAVILFPAIMFRPALWFLRNNSKLRNDFEEVYTNWREKVLKIFLAGFGLTLLAFLALACIPLFFAPQLGQEVGIIPAVSAVSISNMLAFLPVTIAGFGTRELVFSEVWSVLGYTAESAITISTAYFICNYIGSLVLGGVTYAVAFRKHFSLKELRSEKEK